MDFLDVFKVWLCHVEWSAVNGGFGLSRDKKDPRRLHGLSAEGMSNRALIISNKKGGSRYDRLVRGVPARSGPLANKIVQQQSVCVDRIR
jgi:hypothetical protein